MDNRKKSFGSFTVPLISIIIVLLCFAVLRTESYAEDESAERNAQMMEAAAEEYAENYETDFVTEFGTEPVTDFGTESGTDLDEGLDEDCTEEHLWGEWEIVTEPGYHKAGEEKRICLRCGTEETQKIPKLTAKKKWVFENNKWYYLDKNGKFIKAGWAKLRPRGDKNRSFRWCWFSSSGVFKKDISKDTANKWVSAGGKKYWFTAEKKPAKRGFRLIGDKVYYLDADGSMVTGTFRTKGGTKYKTNKDGSLSGLIYYKVKYKTFVLIDISDQKLRFYRDGKRKLTANVVTGTRGVHDTPRGVFHIMSKSRNVNLVGATWNVHVSYWMLFRSGGYGIHDASWRSTAQFDNRRTYLGNGSHGCVNMKPGNAASLYSMVSNGTTVIVCS